MGLSSGIVIVDGSVSLRKVLRQYQGLMGTNNSYVLKFSLVRPTFITMFKFTSQWLSYHLLSILRLPMA